MNRLQLLKVASQVLPFLLSIISILHTIYFFVFSQDGRVFSIIGGIGIMSIIYLWLSSWCFRFCFYQKVFLYYLTISQIVNIIDEYYTLPISNYNYCLVSFITFGCTIILYSTLKFKENKRNNGQRIWFIKKDC